MNFAGGVSRGKKVQSNPASGKPKTTEEISDRCKENMPFRVFIMLYSKQLFFEDSAYCWFFLAFLNKRIAERIIKIAAAATSPKIVS